MGLGEKGGAGRIMRSNLILFVLVLVLQKLKFLTRMFDTQSRTRTSTTTRTRRKMTTKASSCRAVAQRAKAAHLTAVICTLISHVELHGNGPEFHEVSYKICIGVIEICNQ
jgi:hypothetical protein